MEKILFGVQEVAKLLAISRSSVYKFADSGQIPRPVKLGGSVRWLASDLEEWQNSLKDKA